MKITSFIITTALAGAASVAAVPVLGTSSIVGRNEAWTCGNVSTLRLCSATEARTWCDRGTLRSNFPCEGCYCLGEASCGKGCASGGEEPGPGTPSVPPVSPDDDPEE